MPTASAVFCLTRTYLRESLRSPQSTTARQGLTPVVRWIPRARFSTSRRSLSAIQPPVSSLDETSAATEGENEGGRVDVDACT